MARLSSRVTLVPLNVCFGFCKPAQEILCHKNSLERIPLLWLTYPVLVVRLYGVLLPFFLIIYIRFSTAARPGQPAGTSVSHDREPSEDVPQAVQAARQALPPNDTGRGRRAHTPLTGLAGSQCPSLFYSFFLHLLFLASRCDPPPHAAMLLRQHRMFSPLDSLKRVA